MFIIIPFLLISVTEIIISENDLERMRKENSIRYSQEFIPDVKQRSRPSFGN